MLFPDGDTFRRRDVSLTQLIEGEPRLIRRLGPVTAGVTDNLNEIGPWARVAYVEPLSVTSPDHANKTRRSSTVIMALIDSSPVFWTTVQ